jgi:hypothetical protein
VTYAGIKRGDEVLVFHDRVTMPRAGTVRSVGPKWITVEVHGFLSTERFDATSGCGSYGAHVETEATVADNRARTEALTTLRRACDRGCGRNGHERVPTAALVAAAAAVVGYVT